MRRWTIFLALLTVLVATVRAQRFDEEEITGVTEGSADIRKPVGSPMGDDEGDDDDDEGSGRTPPTIIDDPEDPDDSTEATTTRKLTQTPPKPVAVTTSKDVDDSTEATDAVPEQPEKEADIDEELPKDRSSVLNMTTIIIIAAVVAILIILIVVVIIVLRRRAAGKERQRGHKYTQGEKKV